MSSAPYGSWKSPISTALLTAGSVSLDAPVLDGGDLYWLESHADEGGRASIWRLDAEGSVRELTPQPTYVRNRVHEYGGGEFAARSGVVVFSSYPDGRLYAIHGDDEPIPLTHPGALRYADLRVHPEHDLVLAVREDHTVSDSGAAEPVNTIVALTLSGLNDDGGRVLCAGADFYSTPELSEDGRLAWTQWDHPNMPWDSTAIKVGRLEGDSLVDVVHVAGGPDESAVQPRWTGDGALVYVSDRTDWWNLYHWRDGQHHELHRAAAEFADPQWEFGMSPYAMIDVDHLLCTWRSRGVTSLGRLTMSTGALEPLGLPGTRSAALSVSAGRAAAILSYEDQPHALAMLDLTSQEWRSVRASSESRVDPALVSRAEPVAWTSDQGPVFGWFYPPANPDHPEAPDELPPLVTLSHGGPTASSPPSFNLGIQYWTSRGIGVLDVNYGGSTGYGRAYRNRLRGTWGIVDVQDCAAGALAMCELGFADRRRLAIKGGSAGGYTTLRALTATDTFTAGISLFGVGDLEALAKDTHKFESRYLDGLVGPYPAEAERYRERSPIHHVNDLSAPILLLQGADDKVVPPNQAEAMADAARAKGLPVALIIFPGEGHGFRRAENIKISIEAQLYFLGRVFGFTPADELPAIPIENAPR